MRKIFLFLSAALLFAACGKDEPKSERIRFQQDEYEVSEAGETIRVDITANNEYTFEILDDVDWVTLSTTDVSTGETKYFDVAATDKYDPREARIAFTSQNGKTTKEVKIIQSEKLGFDTDAQDVYELGSKGGDITFNVEHNIGGYDISISEGAENWLTQNTSDTRALTTDELSFTATQNRTEAPRNATITLTAKDSTIEPITIEVEQAMIDGEVTVLQTATEGNGIDIVFLGDGYTMTLIANGVYLKELQKAADYFFSVQPYKSFRHLFNVYVVNAVSSSTTGFGTSADNSTTALKGYFGNGTRVGGDDGKCFEYVLKAITEDRMDQVLTCVVMNKKGSRSGTAYSHNPTPPHSDIGGGPWVAYQSQSFSDADFEGLIHHECGGHAFAKLGDEYIYSGYGAIPSGQVTQYKQWQNILGWYKNIDFTDDPDQIRWSRLYKDSRYSSEFSVFDNKAGHEGATWSKGVWRPTYTSIMLDNFGRFNPPSRETIYYRIHKLAYGLSWEYDYEEFVEWDSSMSFGLDSGSATSPEAGVGMLNLPSPTPPVITNTTWREAMNKK